jgi:hypothetical protein
MATKKPTVNNLDFDLTEFKRQQEAVKQYAAVEVANKVEQVKQLLSEIKVLVEVGRIEVKLGGDYGLLGNAIDDVDSAHPDWNSSSMYC